MRTGFQPRVTSLQHCDRTIASFLARPADMRCLLTLFLGLLLTCAQAHAAWWNADWSFRKKVTLDTSDKGAATKENLGQFPLLVRLHTGNFAFSDTREDGADLRFVADDDKTPLKHHIESYDSANELALVWVQVPRIA